MSSSEQKIRYSIDITPRSFLVVALGCASVFALWMIKDFVLLVVLAVIIASFVNAGVRILHRIHIPRAIAVTIMYLFFVGIAVIIALVFLPLLFKEIVTLSALLPNTASNTPWGELITVIAETGLNEETLQELLGTQNIFEGLQNFWKMYFTDSVVTGINSIIQGITKGFLVFIMSFFLSIQAGGLNGFLRAITPIKYESYIINLWNRVEQKIGYWFGGQLIIAIITGIITFIGLSILGMPYALLLSLLVVILEFIPFGLTIGTVIIAPLAFLTGGVALGIPITLFMFVLNFLEANIAQPLVVNKTVGIPMLLVIISVIAWVNLIGWTGAIIAIPFAVLVLELVYDREKKYITHNDS
jgi:predicted PurR-regulated permease PerM